MSQRSGTPRGAVPLTVTYVTFGYFWGTWAVVYLPFIQAHGFSYGRMSVYFMSLTLASMAAMILLAPRSVHLLPSVSLPFALTCYAVGIALMPFVPGVWLFVAFAVAGIGTGLIDVLVNQVGHGLEVVSGRSVLQRIHAGYSLGGVVGALCTAEILVRGGAAGFRLALVVAAVIQGPGVVACVASGTYRSRPPGERSEERMSLSAFAGNPALLVIALIVLSAFFVEGSLDVWAVTYLRQTLGATIMRGALGFAAFGIATAFGRGFAARILFGMGYRRTILFSGLGSVAAGTVAVLAPNPWIATIAYLVLGFCLASAAPAAFGTIAGDGVAAGVSIAAVTTVGYTGFVVGPPIMGWLADAFGVRSTMILITIATLGIGLGGLLSRDPVRRPSSGAG